MDMNYYKGVGFPQNLESFISSESTNLEDCYLDDGVQSFDDDEDVCHTEEQDIGHQMAEPEEFHVDYN